MQNASLGTDRCLGIGETGGANQGRVSGGQRVRLACNPNMDRTEEKKQEPTRSKDLLQLERERNPLQTRLRVCQTNGASLEAKRKGTTSLPESSVMNRVKAFLPIMDEANRKLFTGIQERGPQEYDIEAVDGDSGKSHIEMDLALGVADLKTPEAVAAAERVTAGQTQQNHVSGDFAEDSSDSDSDSDDDSDDDADRTLAKNRSKISKVNLIESSFA